MFPTFTKFILKKKKKVPWHNLIFPFLQILSEGYEEANRGGFAALTGARTPLSCHEAGMINEGLQSRLGVSTSEKETAARETADRFTGVGSH